MSISQLYPNISPSLNLNFARSKTLDPRVTFTRSSSATRMNGQGLIEVVSADQPRFDHSYDSVSGSVRSLGLLVEEQRTNLVTDSATDFNYSFNNQVLPTALDIAPDGNNVLCKHDLSGSTEPFLNCNVDTSLTAGTYTMSMWLKGTTSFSASFAFVGETISEIYSNTADITTSWKRFTLSFTLINTQTASRLQVFFASQGEGKIISVWGAQLESGSFATSYIPRSSGQQATRTADNASMTGTNFSSWYNQSEGTMFANASATTDSIFCVASNSSYSERTFQMAIGSANNYESYFLSSNTIQAGAVLGSNLSNVFSKMVSSGKNNDFAFCLNGETVTTDTSGTFGTSIDNLNIGRYSAGSNYINGSIKQLSYYPKRLTNDQLQNLTK